MVARCGLKILSLWVAVRHHKASLVMPNNNPKWRNFQFAVNSILHTQMHLNVKCIIYPYIMLRNVSFGSYLWRWRQNVNDIKTDVVPSKKMSWCDAWESSDTLVWDDISLHQSLTWKFLSGMQEYISVMSWENILYAICEKQRRRSACAIAQSDQRLYCLLPR